MADSIIRLHQWLDSPPGQYLLAWERQQMELTVGDIFGYHALQLGWPELAALQANRMPHRWLASNEDQKQPPLPAGTSGLHAAQTRLPVQLRTDFSALPFAANSLDLVVMPHSLELSADPHATLREVARVLVAEGKVLICGFNPASLWGLRQSSSKLFTRLGWGDNFLPLNAELIAQRRLRDWLHLLGFEVERASFGCYRPALKSQQWLNRFAWMDQSASRLWPIFGSVYFLVAVKRERGMRLMGPAWKLATNRSNIRVQVANRTQFFNQLGTELKICPTKSLYAVGGRAEDLSRNLLKVWGLFPSNEQETV